jgi:glucosamine 6-phosphate synthetase-like amidotransferase/phosphosugar isomerase protein
MFKNLLFLFLLLLFSCSTAKNQKSIDSHAKRQTLKEIKKAKKYIKKRYRLHRKNQSKDVRRKMKKERRRMIRERKK